MLDDQKLDKLNIAYDICIDEENYDVVRVDLNESSLKEFLTKNPSNDYKAGEVLNALIEYDKSIENDGSAIYISFARIDKYLCRNNNSWYPLFLAKKVRAFVKLIGSTKLDKALDEVAEYLLYRLATLNGEEDDNKPEGFGKRKFRTLYLNEISQCYLGYLSVGYADKALQESGKGECHYELLGLYNKALGLSHHEDRGSREKSLTYFAEVIDPFSKNHFDYGYGFEADLWKRYIYFPALLNKADVLIRLQRGQEAIDALEELGDLLAHSASYSFYGVSLDLDYKKCEHGLLLANAYLETGKIDLAGICLNQIDEPTEGIRTKKRLAKIKYIIEAVSANQEDDLKEAIKESRKHFEEQEHNVSDRAQAAMYWLEAFQLMLRKPMSDENCKAELGFLVTVINFINGHIEGQKWLPKSDYIIEILTKALEQLDSFLEDHSGCLDNSIESELTRFYNLQGEKYGNITPSCIRKIKSTRRLLLNSQLSDHEEFAFPDDNLLDLIGGFAKNNLGRDFYTQRLSLNIESFDERLIYHSHWPSLKKDFVLTTLRKWQSFTPSLGSYSTSSRGGGYFLYKVDGAGRIEEGIVIDPGFDFVENFLEYGFAIVDIDTILLTHSHIDHSADFRSLVTLFHEMNSRGGKKDRKWPHKKVKIVLTSNCFDHFYSFIKDARDHIEDVVVVDPDRYGQKAVETKSFLIKAFAVYHKDLNDGNCVGFTIQDRSKRKYIIGFTGDGVWAHNVASELQYCPVVCLNMGALIDIRKGESFRDLEEPAGIKKVIYNENHLYLPGALSLIEQLRRNNHTKLVVVTELGEEMKCGLRHDLYHNLNQFVIDRNVQGGSNADRKRSRKGQPKVMIEDIGLTVSLTGPGPRIRCTCCQGQVKPEKIELRVTEEGRNNEQIYYYCKGCLEKVGAAALGAEPWWRKPYVPQSKPSWTS